MFLGLSQGNVEPIKRGVSWTKHCDSSKALEGFKLLFNYLLERGIGLSCGLEQITLHTFLLNREKYVRVYVNEENLRVTIPSIPHLRSKHYNAYPSKIIEPSESSKTSSSSSEDAKDSEENINNISESEDAKESENLNYVENHIV
jgi:hypothetical protein